MPVYDAGFKRPAQGRSCRRALRLGSCEIASLVYTGITRGKKLVVVVGQRKALAIAVKNNRTENRFPGLLARLR